MTMRATTGRCQSGGHCYRVVAFEEVSRLQVRYNEDPGTSGNVLCVRANADTTRRCVRTASTEG